MNRFVIIFGLVFLPLMVLAPGPACHSQRFTYGFFAWLLLAGMLKNRWLQYFVCYLLTWQFCVTAGWMFGWATAEMHLFTLSAMNYVMFGVLVYYAASRLEIPQNWIYNAVCVSALVQAALVVSQGLGYDVVITALKLYKPNIFNTLTREHHVLFGSLGNPNFLAAWLAVTVSFFFRARWKWCIPLIALVLLATKSEIAIISAVAAAAVFSRKWYILLILPACAVGYLIWRQGGSLDFTTYAGTRWENWCSAWNKMVVPSLTAPQPKLFFGVGYGGIEPDSPIHNEYLNLCFRWGAVPLVLVLGFLWNLPRKNPIFAAALAALLVNSLGSYPMRIPPIAYFACALFGFMQREGRYELT